MSQICYQPVTLDQVVASATAILVVKKRDPESVVVSVPVAADPERCPPFGKRRYCFEVIETLFSASGVLFSGPIDVDEANSAAQLRIHAKYYLEGIGISPIYRQYTAPAPPTGGRSIIFISATGDGYEFAVDGAETAESMKASIVALLR